MTSPALLNQLTPPQFPLMIEHYDSLSVQTLAAHIAARPELWFHFIKDMGTHQTNLSNLCVAHEATMTRLRQENYNHEITITRLNHENYDTSKQLVRALSQGSHVSGRSTNHPDPAIYSGMRSELEPFLSQLRTKLTLNNDHFDTETKKIYYASSRLEGDVYR